MSDSMCIQAKSISCNVSLGVYLLYRARLWQILLNLCSVMLLQVIERLRSVLCRL